LANTDSVCASRSRHSPISHSRRFSRKVPVPHHTSANRSAAAWLQLAGAGRNDNPRARALGGPFDPPPPSLAHHTASAVAPRHRVTFTDRYRVPVALPRSATVRSDRRSISRERASRSQAVPGRVRSVRNVCRHPGCARANRQMMVDGASTPAAAKRTIPRARLGRLVGALRASR
jgi:hypothetical protein